MGAEARTELSLERCTQPRTVEDYDVVEEMAREAFHLAEWEAVAPEDLLQAWYLLHPYGP